MRKSALLLFQMVLCPHLKGCSFTETAEPAVVMMAFGSLSKEEQALMWERCPFAIRSDPI